MPRGMRPLTVDGRRFLRRFDKRIVVVPEGRSRPQLYVDWGWCDWLEPDATPAETQIVTPKFVSEAVRYAIERGWCQQENVPPMRLQFENGSFFLTGE